MGISVAEIQVAAYVLLVWILLDHSPLDLRSREDEFPEGVKVHLGCGEQGNGLLVVAPEVLDDETLEHLGGAAAQFALRKGPEGLREDAGLLREGYHAYHIFV